MSTRDKDSVRAPTAIVTGANRGIGFGVAQQLADRGYRVILAARDEAKGQAAAEKLEADPDEESIASFTRALSDDGSSIDALVNNASVAIEGFDKQVARRTMDTNFCGPVRLTDAVVPLMNEGGRVVMVSSGAGTLSILSPELQDRFAADDLTREKLSALVEQFVDDVARGSHSEAGWPTSCYRAAVPWLSAEDRLRRRLVSTSQFFYNRRHHRTQRTH